VTEVRSGGHPAGGASLAPGARRGRPTRRGPLARAVLFLPLLVGGWVVRSRRFLREVVSELRKVIYPSRTELITYVTVVLIFVTFMVAFVAGLDYAFTKAVLAVFG
jgi:preprotein translocase SecE subunit